MITGNKHKFKEREREKPDNELEKPREEQGGERPDGQTGNDIPEATAGIDRMTAIYNKIGFEAALHHRSLEEVKGATRTDAMVEIKALFDARSERLTIINEEFVRLAKELAEKDEIKTKFIAELDKMKIERDMIKGEIKGYYDELRSEIQNLGVSRDGMILKRICEFDAELEKLVATYQEIENKQNDKFKSDFAARSIGEKDRQFYYDYRTKMEESLTEVQKRVGALEKEGLNPVISRFLVPLGWISAFVSSWFFGLWFDGRPSGETQNSGLATYILDKLRNFTLQQGWLVSTLVVLGYIAVVMMIARFCYGRLRSAKFIPGRKDNNPGEEAQIEFNPENANLIKSQFKAGTWYELWLKIAPFVAGVFLLIIILAVGSGPNDTYESLGNSLALQSIGFLFPIATTALFFLYITKVVESRAMKASEERRPAWRAFFANWEIGLAILSFIALIGLLLVCELGKTELNIKLIGAWGFFIGCLCTGLSLGYAYRFLSLNEARNILVYVIHSLNGYIERAFHPFQVSYLKDNEIIHRMKVLYHSVLDLLQSKNNVALRLMNPQDKVSRKEPSADPEAGAETAKEEVKTEKGGLFKIVVTAVSGWVQSQEKKFKIWRHRKDTRIKDLEAEVKFLRADNINEDELIYFPGGGAKVRQIKMLIEERQTRLKELKGELDGYYRCQQTFASLQKQIDKLHGRKVKLAESIEEIKTEGMEGEKTLRHELTIKEANIEEGYIVGVWFINNNYNR